MIHNPKSIIEEDLNKIFKKKKQSEISLLISIVSLILYRNEYNSDIVDLFHTLDDNIDLFIKIIHLFDGRTIKFPRSDDFSEYLLLAICYYYKEIEGKSWDEISELFPEVNFYHKKKLGLSLKINHLDNFIKQKVEQILSEIDLKGEKDER